jgi:hypothetical protein
MKADKSKERPKDKAEPDEQKVSTLKELLRDKPKRGRPRRMVARQNVYVALRPEQKALMAELAGRLPAGLGRPDVPDLAVSVLTARMEALRSAVAGRTREIPEGVTDLESLYLLWDVAPPVDEDRRQTPDDRRQTAAERRTVADRRHAADEADRAAGGDPSAGQRPPAVPTEKWTSIRLSPQQVLELGRLHGTLNAAYGAGRSEVFGLALALLAQFLERQPLDGVEMGLGEVREMIFRL